MKMKIENTCTKKSAVSSPGRTFLQINSSWLRKLRGTSIGRAFPMLYQVPGARRTFLVKDIGKWLPWTILVPGSTGRIVSYHIRSGRNTMNTAVVLVMFNKHFARKRENEKQQKPKTQKKKQQSTTQEQPASFTCSQLAFVFCLNECLL